MNKEKFTRLPPGWNIRVFTDEDFHRFCEEERIAVYESEMAIPGAYCLYSESPVIFINQTLPSDRKLFINFHELTHHWLHYPGTQFFLNNHTKVENEANIVAGCALIPVTLLTVKSKSEIIDEYGCSLELVNIRSGIYRRLRILDGQIETGRRGPARQAALCAHSMAGMGRRAEGPAGKARTGQDDQRGQRTL